MTRTLFLVSALALPLPESSLCGQMNNPGQPQPLERRWQRDPLEITAWLSTGEPFVSDRLDVRVRVRGPAGTQIELPGPDSFTRDFEISGVERGGPVPEPDGTQAWELVFRLEVLLPGTYELPALEVRHRPSGDSEWQAVRTEPIPIEFQSMLGPDADSAAPRPNPGPAVWRRGPLPWALWIAILVALLLVAGAAWFAWSRRSRRPPPAPRISAYRKAMDAIHRIDMAGWLERGEIDRFYTELSGVVRHYIEDRFRVHATEQTTEEFLDQLVARPVLAAEQRLALRHFLEQCDLVKFAKARPAGSEGQAVLRAARSFVESTRDDALLVER